MEKEEEIWDRLKHNFGDPNEILGRKLKEIHETANLFGPRKGSKELKYILLELTNKLKDITKLVTT